MNNNPNKTPSDKKDVLNFNADVWQVDMPAARAVANTPQTPPATNAQYFVPRAGGANYNPYAPYQNSVPSVTTVVPDNNAQKSNTWKIVLIIVVTAIIVFGLFVIGYEYDYISLSVESGFAEIVSQFSGEATDIIKAGR